MLFKGYTASSRRLCDEHANILSKRHNTWQTSPTPLSRARCCFNDADLCFDGSWVVISQLPPKTHQRSTVLVKDRMEQQRSVLRHCYLGDPPYSRHLHLETKSSGLALIYSPTHSATIPKSFNLPPAFKWPSPLKTAVIPASPNLPEKVPREVVQSVSP